MPAITIVTAAFNAEVFLPRFFSSIELQLFKDYELLIVNDGSMDNTKLIVEQQILLDERIRLINLPCNIGASGARNAGLCLARGEYICFLDVDDYWLPEKLQTQITFMRNKGCDLTYMDYLRIDKDLNPLTLVVASDETTYAQMLKSNRIGNLTAMFRREASLGLQFDDIGHEDYVFWLALLSRIGKAFRVPTKEPLCLYMVRQASLSSNKFKAARWQWRIYRRVIGMPFIVSAWYMAHYTLASLGKRI